MTLGALPVFKPGQKQLSASRMNNLVNQVQNLSATQDTGGRVIYVRNDTGSALPIFSVLGVGDIIREPTANYTGFIGDVFFKGVTPNEDDHTGKFCVIQRPALSGASVPAILTGTSQVKIDVQDEDDEYAEISDGETGYLESASAGTAQILWKEPGTGEVWALVRFPFRRAEWIPIALQGVTCALSMSETVYGIHTNYSSWTNLHSPGFTIQAGSDEFFLKKSGSATYVTAANNLNIFANISNVTKYGDYTFPYTAEIPFARMEQRIAAAAFTKLELPVNITKVRAKGILTLITGSYTSISGTLQFAPDDESTIFDLSYYDSTPKLFEIRLLCIGTLQSCIGSMTIKCGFDRVSFMRPTYAGE